MSDTDEKLREELNRILARITPYMQAEEARLRVFEKAGEDWGDFAKDKLRDDVMDSRHLIMTKTFFSSREGIKEGDPGLPITIKVDPKDDIRLARVVDKAIELKKEYGGKNVDQYIYKQVLAEINKQYGSYDPTVGACLRDIRICEKNLQLATTDEARAELNTKLKGLYQKMDESYDNRVYSKKENNSFNINDFQTGKLVCREYTAVASMALHYAGIENHYVIGDITSENSTSTGRHAFLVSKKTGNIMEVTSNDANSLSFSYAKILNKEADLKKGETLVALRADGVVVCYGSGEVNGQKSDNKQEINEYHQKLIDEAKVKYKDEIDKAKSAYNKTAPKNKFDPYKYWDFKDDKLISIDGKHDIPKEKHYTKAGELEGYNIGKQILVEDDKKQNFIIHDAESGKKLGIAPIAAFNADSKDPELKQLAQHAPKKEQNSSPPTDEDKNALRKRVVETSRHPVRREIIEHWEYKGGKFTSDEGKTVTKKGDAYHFHDMGCSLVPQKDGSFTIWVKDTHGKAKVEGKITKDEINRKSNTVMLEEAANAMHGLAEYNKGEAQGLKPHMVADTGLSRSSGQQQV